MTARMVLLNLALWALCAYATLQLVHSGMVDVLGPMEPPPAWMERYAQDLASRGLPAQAAEAYAEILRGSRVGAQRRSELHLRMAQLLEQDPSHLDDALAHYLRVLYLSAEPAMRHTCEVRIQELTRLRAGAGRASAGATAAGQAGGAPGAGGAQGTGGAASATGAKGAGGSPAATPAPGTRDDPGSHAAPGTGGLGQPH